MIQIHLEYDKGFSWFYENGIWVKGYIFDEKNRFYAGGNALKYFADIGSTQTFADKMKRANGSFAVVMKRGETVFAATDRLRSIPLFYLRRGSEELVIADNADFIKSQFAGMAVDEIRIREFELTGYTCGDGTLYRDIKQLRAGEYLRSEKGCFYTGRYYLHLHTNFFDRKPDEFYRKLDAVSENVFKRLIRSAGGKTIVIPLSGGYDSRYIAAMLKRLDYKKIICYTYGRPDSFEAKISRNVARQLGYEWHHILYDSAAWRTVFSDKNREYFRFAGNLSSLPHIQDFFAVMNLTARKIIPADAVIVPGYCGDLLGGSYLAAVPADISLDGITEYLYKSYFNLAVGNAACKQEIIKDLRHELPLGSVKTKDEFSSMNEEWFTCHKAAKFVVNAVRIYEYFGYEWRLPLWDRELMEFWYGVPNKYRKNSRLYNDYLLHKVFAEYRIDFVKRENILVSGRCRLYLLRLFKRILAKILPGEKAENIRRAILDRKYKKTIDFNRFSDIYSILSRSVTGDRADKKIIDAANPNSIIAVWYLEQFVRGVRR